MRETYLKNVHILTNKMVEELGKWPDIPLIGQARCWVNDKLENYEFIRDVDFTILKKLLGQDYIYYIVFYEKIIDEVGPSFEKRKYMIMMNLLAALKDEKGFRNALEKWLLASRIKKLYKEEN